MRPELQDADHLDVEIAMLLEAVYAYRGYDFRQYSRASIKRRVLRFLIKHRMNSIAAIKHQIQHDNTFFNLLITEFSITVTEMFRYPSLFVQLRENLLSIMHKKARLKIWSAGSATGEEAYSLAILLHELGLLERAQIYATDINSLALETAKRGLIPINKIKHYTTNYQQSGGKEDFCNYYTTCHNFVSIEKFLKEHILFTQHNLVHDMAFGDMDLIFCRNVMIYFTPELQNRVVGLFLESLTTDGILCLGDKESLYLSGHQYSFTPMENIEKCYQKKTTEVEKNNVVK